MTDAASDLALARASANGDQEAFGLLYNRYFDRLYDFCVRTLGDGDAAADAVQETFVRAWTGLQSGAVPDHPKAWLFTVARNASLDELRRRKRTTSIDDRPPGDDADGPTFDKVDPSRANDPSAALADTELAALVWAAARGLGPKDYALLDMHVRQELTIEEIAGTLKAKVGTVYTMLSRLRDAVESSVAAELLRRRGRDSCNELDRIIADHDELDRKLRLAIEAHVRQCDRCGERRRTMVSPVALFGALAPVAAVPGLRESIWESMLPRIAGGPPPGGGGSQRLASGKSRAFLGGGAVAGIGAAVVAVLALLGVFSGDDAPKLVAATLGEPVNTGYVFINGQYLPPPYRFDVGPTSVALNGQQLLAAREKAPPPKTGEPTNAVQVVARGTARMIEKGLVSQGVGDAARADLVAFLKSFPVTASVEDQGTQIRVKDTHGDEAYLVLETDIASGDDQAADFKAQAQAWQDTLTDGGVLLISAGVSVQVAPGRALPLFALIHQVATSGMAPETFARTIGDPTVAADLAAAGDLPASLRQRLPAQLPAPLAAPAAARPRIGGTRGTGIGILADTGDHEVSNTPGSKNAYIFRFTEFTKKQQEKADARGEGGTPWKSVQQAARLHGYDITTYRRLATGFKANQVNFVWVLKNGNPGILYVDSHGGGFTDSNGNRSGALQIDTYPDADSLIEDLNKIRPNNPDLKDLNIAVGAEISYFGEVSVGLFIKPDGDPNTPNRGTGLKQLFKDHDSIVEIDACFSMLIQSAFATAREFIGVEKKSYSSNAVSATFNEELWGSMDGTLHSGHDRNVDKAFANAKKTTAIYEWVSRVEGRTVLSPAVAKKDPDAAVAVPAERDGFVVFDAEMDVSRLPQLDFEGDCKPSLVPGSEKWTDSRTLSFRLKLEQPGAARVIIRAANAASKNNGVLLDGNTNWVGKTDQTPGRIDHVGPNEDDYIWGFGCIAAPSTGTGTGPGQTNPGSSPGTTGDGTTPGTTGGGTTPSTQKTPGPGSATETPGQATTTTPTPPTGGTPPSTTTPGQATETPGTGGTPTPPPSTTPPPASPSPTQPRISGTYGGNVSVTSDPAGHSPFIKPSTSWDVLQQRNTQTGEITIQLGGILPGITLAARINATGDTFTASMLGTVAGRPNVLVSFTGNVSSGLFLSGTLTVGGNGALPQGLPIVFSVRMQQTAPRPD